MKDYRNKMGEVQAKQRTIISAYKIDEKAAAVLIDEKTDIMNQQMKEQVAHKVSVNSILTEEQVLKLEQHRKQRIAHRGGKGNFGSGCQNGPRHGKGPGAGRNL